MLRKKIKNMRFPSICINFLKSVIYFENKSNEGAEVLIIFGIYRVVNHLCQKGREIIENISIFEQPNQDPQIGLEICILLNNQLEKVQEKSLHISYVLNQQKGLNLFDDCFCYLFGYFLLKIHCKSCINSKKADTSRLKPLLLCISFYQAYNIKGIIMFCYPFLYYPFLVDPSICNYAPISSELPIQSHSSSQSQATETSRQDAIVQDFQKIILTKQDLQKAGYSISKKIWTQEEDKLLVFLREKKKMDWAQISRKIADRNKKMCYSRYRRLKNSTKLQWLKKDDDKLLRLVQIEGQKWDQIAKHFKNRNIRQVKQHYNNYLRPGIIQCEWNLDDDLKLIQLLNSFGKNWKMVEQGLDGRSLNQIKNRYYGRIKKLNDKKLSNVEILQQSSQ